MRHDDPQKRSFYEIESVNSNWSTRELVRQMNSMLFERLALSRDKDGVMALAAEGLEPNTCSMPLEMPSKSASCKKPGALATPGNPGG